MTYDDPRHAAVPMPRTDPADRAGMRTYLENQGYPVPGADRIPHPRAGDTEPLPTRVADWRAPAADPAPTNSRAQFWGEPAAQPVDQQTRYGEDVLDLEEHRRRQTEYEADRNGLPFLTRGRVVDRLVSIGALHAQHGADLIRTRKEVCEHAFAQFSVTPNDNNAPVGASTKLAHSDEKNADLLNYLHSMTRFVIDMTEQARRSRQRYDPRVAVLSGPAMANRTDNFHPSMHYVGVGVSTLDTPEMPWQQMKAGVTKNDALRLRSQGYLYLADGTFVHILRESQQGEKAGQHTIKANRTVQHWRYRIERHLDLREQFDPYIRQVWDSLQALHQALSAAVYP